MSCIFSGRLRAGSAAMDQPGAERTESPSPAAFQSAWKPPVKDERGVLQPGVSTAQRFKAGSSAFSRCGGDREERHAGRGPHKVQQSDQPGIAVMAADPLTWPSSVEHPPHTPDVSINCHPSRGGSCTRRLSTGTLA